MTRISSSWTSVHKKIFPAFWFGFLALFLVGGLVGGAARQSASFLIIPVVMGVFGYLMMKRMVWDLVDEVYDTGDSLLVRNRGQEALVPLSSIMNVSTSTHMNPPRITLKLVRPVVFGDEITFSPVTGFRINPFAKNKVAEDLIMRVHQARDSR